MPFFVILACLPLGIRASYVPGAFRMEGYVWFVPFRIGRKGRRETEKPAGTSRSGLKRFYTGRHALQILLKNGYTILCRLISRVRVEHLTLHFTAAGSDPAGGALMYGAAGIALEGLSAACAGRAAHTDLKAEVDFQRERPSVRGSICLSLPAWRAIGAAARFGWCVLRDHHRLEKGSMNAHDQSAAW